MRNYEKETEIKTTVNGKSWVSRHQTEDLIKAYNQHFYWGQNHFKEMEEMAIIKMKQPKFVKNKFIYIFPIIAFLTTVIGTIIYSIENPTTSLFVAYIINIIIIIISLIAGAAKDDDEIKMKTKSF